MEKVVKLLLRCIAHVLDTESENERVVSTIGEALFIMLQRSRYIYICICIQMYSNVFMCILI